MTRASGRPDRSMSIVHALPSLLLVACVVPPPPGSTDGPSSTPDAGADAPRDAEAGARPVDLGVTWTPIGYPSPTPSDRAAFYAGHAAYGTQIAVHRPWRQDRPRAGEADPFVAPIAVE